MARVLLPLCITLAGVAFASGYALGGQWLGVSTVGALALLWLFSYHRSWKWAASFALVGFTGVAVTGLSLGLGAGWMLAGLVATLCGWDLHRFVLRLRSVKQIEAENMLQQGHLQRLLAVAGLGWLLAAIALTVETRISFLFAVLLGLLAIWGVTRAVGFLRREGG